MLDVVNESERPIVCDVDTDVAAENGFMMWVTEAINNGSHKPKLWSFVCSIYCFIYQMSQVVHWCHCGCPGNSQSHRPLP